MAIDFSTTLAGLFSKFTGIGYILIIVLLLGGFLALMLWLIYNFVTYKDKVLIYDVIGQGKPTISKIPTRDGKSIINDVDIKDFNLYFDKSDKGKWLINKGNNEGYKLYRVKEPIAQFSSKFFIRSKSGNLLHLIRYNNQFIPFLPHNPDKIPYTSEQLKLFHVQQTEKIHKKYLPKDFWSKYGHIVLWGGTLVFCTIIIIIMFNKFEYLKPLADSLYSVADKCTGQRIG